MKAAVAGVIHRHTRITRKPQQRTCGDRYRYILNVLKVGGTAVESSFGRMKSICRTDCGALWGTEWLLIDRLMLHLSFTPFSILPMTTSLCGCTCLPKRCWVRTTDFEASIRSACRNASMRPEGPNSLATADSLKRNPLNCFQHHGTSCSIEVWVVDEDDNLKHEAMPG